MNPTEENSAFLLRPGELPGPAHRFVHHAMACTWEVYVPHEDARYAGQAARAVFEEVDRVEAELSRFVEHSDIGRINALAAGQSVQVGVDALECLEMAARVRAETDGAFDVTVGGLLPNTGQDGGRRTGADGGPAAQRAAAGMDAMEIDRTRRTVTVRAEGVVVDLGGIGKGYAIDQAAAVLRDWSIASALIHAGQSTVFALSDPPGRSTWAVAIRDPNQRDASLGVVHLRDQAVSGSGMGDRGPHIVDPRTGRPPIGRIGAWALAPSAADSDALSTAFMVLSPHRVAEYCRGHREVGGLQCVGEAGARELLRHGVQFELQEGGDS